jgi:hypothetical protein
LTRRTDVLVVGASLGGVAAALAASQTGAQVTIVESGAWIGGQLTAQGVCTPDENRWIEAGGCTRSYSALRRAIREHYRTRHRLSSNALASACLNPGSCWVSRISVEPRVAETILRAMVAREPGITLLDRSAVVAARMVRGPGGTRHDRVEALTVRGPDASMFEIAPTMVVDATELGDLLPMTGTEWRLGAEGADETGEPDAPRQARPDWVQPFTFPFALERRPRGEDHTIPRPTAYAANRRLQRYHALDGAMRGMFGDLGWWEYRRVIAASNFDDPAFPCDIAMINTGSNDFRGGALPAASGTMNEVVMARGRLASLGYVYWLQTECPREDAPGERGYPELRVRADWFDTPDGLAPSPYIRESRRIVPVRTVREHDIVAHDAGGQAHQSGPRAAFCPDSVGIGHYWLDIHEGGSDEPGRFLETRPYQIPLGAIVPVRMRNLLPGCKNTGVTHLASGAFRLHPVEWNIGESVGTLAAFCVEQDVEPREVLERNGLLAGYQRRLLDRGVPLFWWGNLTHDHPAWRRAQEMAMAGTLDGGDAIEMPDETAERLGVG